MQTSASPSPSVQRNSAPPSADNTTIDCPSVKNKHHMLTRSKAAGIFKPKIYIAIKLLISMKKMYCTCM